MDEDKVMPFGLYDAIVALVEYGEADLDAVLELVKQFWKHASELKKVS